MSNNDDDSPYCTSIDEASAAQYLQQYQQQVKQREQLQRAMPSVRRKLVIIGDGACGKTSLLMMFSAGYFPEVHVPTVFETSVASVQVYIFQLIFKFW